MAESLDQRASAQCLTVLGCLVILQNVRITLEMLTIKLTIEGCQEGQVVCVCVGVRGREKVVGQDQMASPLRGVRMAPQDLV